MEFDFPYVALLRILSYLDGFSLLQAAQVNKDWNAIASSDILWKKLCLKRWLFCEDVTPQLLGTETWKQFFVCQTWQEHIKSRAKLEDFTYKEIYVEPHVGLGIQGYACYLSGRGLTRIRQDRSVVCILSSLAKISTWDIHEGVMTWVSPEQPTYIKMLTTLPEMHIAVTVDIQQTIKLWDCHNTEALATNRLLFPCQSLEAVFTKDGPIVLVSDTIGDLYIFRIPDLHLISKVHAFQSSIEELYCSPQKKWVFLSKKHTNILPKVYFLSSLLRTSEFSAPVSTILSFSLCQGACWTPRREDRITLMARHGPKQVTKFATFDMKLEEIGNQLTVNGHLVASFELQYYDEILEWIGVSDKNVIVCSTVSSLLLFSMEGYHLQRFQYYLEEILRLWVDPVYVIVTFIDGSLDVYAWEERSLLLRKCYRLPNWRCQKQQYTCNKTLCDDVSIIRMMTNRPAPNYLMAYTLNIFS
ncbi:F-box/WD repeat-containing protein 15-like isoform X4 [Arvicanthis niloticus]|uniref:F-box/WD repeat-containing protein 15-like isoform X4 n=1 Tax=Arvicanthis niloticus TaxID=61156 RepID=UPI001486D802|nr:F-box/WD repeat-containing protein 15-like isoform X4 [Arvicanthis niloticus]